MKILAIILAWIGGVFSNVNKNLLDPIAGYVAGSNPKIQETSNPNNDQLPITNDQTSGQKPTQKLISIKPTVTPASATAPAGEWGVARQVGEHTWTMRVGDDERMATPQEILTALNEYRVRRGSQRLTWDEKLGNYAQGRANYLASIKNVDAHKGFEDFLKNQDGFEKLGFSSLGENISYGYRMEGVHLIEWIYAGDKPHDDNQVDNRWNYVGIGVKDTATAIIFGTGKR